MTVAICARRVRTCVLEPYQDAALRVGEELCRGAALLLLVLVHEAPLSSCAKPVVVERLARQLLVWCFAPELLVGRPASLKMSHLPRQRTDTPRHTRTLQVDFALPVVAATWMARSFLWDVLGGEHRQLIARSASIRRNVTDRPSSPVPSPLTHLTANPSRPILSM